MARNLAEQGYGADGASSDDEEESPSGTGEEPGEGVAPGAAEDDGAIVSEGTEDTPDKVAGGAGHTDEAGTSSLPSGEEKGADASGSGSLGGGTDDADATIDTSSGGAGAAAAAAAGAGTAASAATGDDDTSAEDTPEGDPAEESSASGGWSEEQEGTAPGSVSEEETATPGASDDSPATEAIPIALPEDGTTSEDKGVSEADSGGEAESGTADEDTSPATEAFVVPGTGGETEAPAESAGTGTTPAEDGEKTTALQDPAEDDEPGDQDDESFAAAEPPSTAPFPAPAPAGTDAAESEGIADTGEPAGADREDSSEEETGGDSTADAETSFWPAPQRFSEYSGETAGSESVGEAAGNKDEAEEEPSGAGAAVGAGAAAAGTAAATGAAQASEGQEAGAEAGSGGSGGPGKPGGKAAKKKRPMWWRILRPVLIVMGVFLVLGIAGFAYLYTTVEVPDAAKAEATDQGSTFYFADGETEFAERGTNREPISYDGMTAGGDHVVDAMTSAEDRGFWEEPGVSISGTARAVWSTITGEQVQGGSTITQQMVRNYYEGVSREQTVARKIQEIIISIKVDQNESKEWVMEQYLNTIYFGRQAYGIQSAAEVYYHKSVDELTPEEAALLSWRPPSSSRTTTVRRTCWSRPTPWNAVGSTSSTAWSPRVRSPRTKPPRWSSRCPRPSGPPTAPTSAATGGTCSRKP